MEKNEKISVIIPVYNSENYLKECLSSIVKQSYKNMEIIIVDNNSTDKSLEICQYFKKSDARIKLLIEKKQGASNARNKGIENATGKYLMFIDSDDYIDLELIERAIKKFNKYKIELVEYEIKFAKDIYRKVLKDGLYDSNKFIDKIIKKEKINSPVNKIYLSKIIKEKNIKFNERFDIGEDLLFNIQYFKYVKKIYYINKELYYYRVNENSITHNYIETRYEQLIQINNQIINICKNSTHAVKYIRLKNIISSIKYWKKYNIDKNTIVIKIKNIKRENVKVMMNNNSFLNKIIFLTFYIFPSELLYIIF